MDRLEAAVAPQVVPLHKEAIVGKLSEHLLGHGLERALARPRRAVVPSADVEPNGHVGRYSSRTAVSAAMARSTSVAMSKPAASNLPIHVGSTRYGYSGKSNCK